MSLTHLLVIHMIVYKAKKIIVQYKRKILTHNNKIMQIKILRINFNIDIFSIFPCLFSAPITSDLGSKVTCDWLAAAAV